ncbi:unnamed protein product [Prunus armeniaca]
MPPSFCMAHTWHGGYVKCLSSFPTFVREILEDRTACRGEELSYTSRSHMVDLANCCRDATAKAGVANNSDGSNALHNEVQLAQAMTVRISWSNGCHGGHWQIYKGARRCSCTSPR